MERFRYTSRWSIKITLEEFIYKVSHETWQLVNYSLEYVFFLNLLSCFDNKDQKIIIWKSCYIKIDFKVKYNEAKDFFD